MAVAPAQVKELRERTGAGMMNCKKALEDSGGDMDRAITILKEQGIALAGKRATREAGQGIVEAYIHAGGKVGVLVELDCETDFVAKTDEFKLLAREIGMQVAAMSPEYVSPDEVPTDRLEEEKRIFRQRALEEGKPEHAVDKIVDGRVEKFLSQICLLNQAYVRDDKRTVGDLVSEATAKLGERVVVRRFARYQVGEAARS
ncbi:MAG TPA: translation elongation factor Ts [Armatimonadota bacterium]|nr:translation elongation factor Ts [Armatimonadota bacterium]